MAAARLSKRLAVFLDRDGVLNQAIVREGRPFSPSRLDDVVVLRGVPEACAELQRQGLLLVVVSNQPEVARGRISLEVVEEINTFLRGRIPLDDIRVCYHDDADDCECRKPKPGLLLAATQDWNIDLGRSFIVGDRWRDIEAGRRAGCQSILIDYHYAETRPEGADFTTSSLPLAMEWILAQVKSIG